MKPIQLLKNIQGRAHQWWTALEATPPVTRSGREAWFQLFLCCQLTSAVCLLGVACLEDPTVAVRASLGTSLLAGGIIAAIRTPRLP